MVGSIRLVKFGIPALVIVLSLLVMGLWAAFGSAGAGVKENGFINGYFTIEKNGVVVAQGHNIITTAGLNQLGELIGNTADANDNFDRIAVGTDDGTVLAVAVANTALGAELTASRADGTYSATADVGGEDIGTWSISKQFTVAATAATGVILTGSAIKEAGVFSDNATTPVLLSRQTFGTITVVTGDTLTITWTYDLDGV